MEEKVIVFKMDECRECEGAIIQCLDEECKILQCPRCGNKTDEWGKKIKWKNIYKEQTEE